MDSSYSDFLATHPSLLSEPIDPLEADNWFCTTESKFGLLHCVEYQMSLYAAQQLRGSVGAWWATYTAILQNNHQVPWGEFRIAFCGHHIPASLMHQKQQNFLDMQQVPNSVYDYSKFNYLAHVGGRETPIFTTNISIFYMRYRE
jgi:hypothetical protein